MPFLRSPSEVAAATRVLLQRMPKGFCIWGTTNRVTEVPEGGVEVSLSPVTALSKQWAMMLMAFLPNPSGVAAGVWLQAARTVRLIR